MTVLPTLTLDLANELLDAAVAEKGEDYIYPRANTADKCVYVERIDGEFRPSCLVGNVLMRHGVPADALYDNDEVHGKLYTLESDLGLAYDTEADLLLGKAQELQDSGVTWGSAVAQARAFVDASTL